MTVNAERDLSAILNERRTEIQRQAKDAITDLKTVADRLGLKETANALQDVAAGLESETFNVMVTGRFKNGKSTFTNALLGGTTKPVNLEGGHGLMVVDDLPATAVLSAVNFADTPSITVKRLDRTAETWTLSRYLRESTLGDDEEENKRRFQGIAQFEIGFPAKLCESRVTLYDSPGLDEHETRTKITLNALKQCDTALLVYRSDSLMGEGELEVDAMVRATGTRVFVIVNLWDGRVVDEKIRARVWNKYVKDYLEGPAWSGQDLADYDIYFVDAKAASNARYGGGEEATRRSGLAHLEDRLGRFLIEDRLRTHLEKYTTAAVHLGDGIAQQISQRRAAIGADRDRLRQAWEAEQPRLAELRARPDRLPKIIDRYRAEALDELSSSFSQLVAGIRRDLPDHLYQAQLPTSNEKLLKAYHQKRLMSEAVGEIQSFIDRRVTEWSEGPAQAFLEGLMGRMNAEVSDEVVQIGRQFDSINMALTGWHQVELENPGAIVSTKERVAAAVAGFLVGDIVGAFTGGAGGWRGAVGSFAGAVGASVVLVGVLGISTAGAAIPIMAAAAIAGAMLSSQGMDKRVKDKALASADETLRPLPAETAVQFRDDLKDRFEALGQVVTEQVRLFINDQVSNIEAQVHLNEQDQATKEQALLQLKQAEAVVNQRKDALNKALTIAKQG
jgi:hypothetical protein